MPASRFRDDRLTHLRVMPKPPTAIDEEEREREDDEPEGLSLDLPPLGADEEEEPEESFEELLQTLDGAEDSLDDAMASDLEVGVEIAFEDSGAGDDEPADENIDVGALHDEIIDDDAGSWLAGESAQREDDHDEIEEDDSPQGDDGGAEGTGEDPADEVDESELPALDADDEGTYEAEDLVAELPDLADDEPPEWDALPWVLVEGAGALVPCAALAVSGGMVIAGSAGAEVGTAGEGAGRSGSRTRRADRAAGDRGTLLLVDPGAQAARKAGIEAAASSVALADGAILIATRRGNLLRSIDGGKTASSLGTWSSSATPTVLATTPGRLWVLAGGMLWSPATSARTGDVSAPPRHDDTALPTRGAPALSPGVAVKEGVLRIAASEGVIVALMSTPAGPQLELLRGDDESSPGVPLSSAARRAAEAPDGRLAAAAGGRAIALSGTGLLCISHDRGETFRVLDSLPPVLGLAFAGDQKRAPLLALVARERDARAQLIHVPMTSSPTIVAEIEVAPAAEPDEEPTPPGGAALEWDPSREVAWIACPAGLFAITRQRKH